jgi:hypothetical protein
MPITRATRRRGDEAGVPEGLTPPGGNSEVGHPAAGRRRRPRRPPRPAAGPTRSAGSCPQPGGAVPGCNAPRIQRRCHEVVQALPLDTLHPPHVDCIQVQGDRTDRFTSKPQTRSRHHLGQKSVLSSRLQPILRMTAHVISADCHCWTWAVWRRSGGTSCSAVSMPVRNCRSVMVRSVWTRLWAT